MLKLVKTFPPLLQYGRNALEIVMKSIVNLDSPMVSPPPDYPGEFFKGNLKMIITGNKDDILLLQCFPCLFDGLGSIPSIKLDVVVYSRNPSAQHDEAGKS